MMKINKFEIENVKRVKAVKIEPTANGLTVIGGKNNQGKTSILDSIAWALGGNKYKPSQATREGSVIPPNLKITMSNGLVVERKGKNSDLKVIDPNGEKAGQQLLNSFVEELAIDLPKFMDSSNKEKADTLLQIIGVGEKLHLLDKEEAEVYNNRRAIGQLADQKKKYAKEQTYYPEVPKEPVSANDLIQQQQTILAKNGENQQKRQNLTQLTTNEINQNAEIERVEAHLNDLKKQYHQTTKDLEIAKKDALDLQDESTEELEKNMQEIDEINVKVRANLDKEKAEDDALEHSKKYDLLSQDINKLRTKKSELLDNADLPLEGLSVDEGELIFNGQQWDNMSGSDQMKVSTAIVRKLKPNCGFILLDKLEQMDLETLNEFSKWLEQEGLQAIATRVGTGEECQIIIEDGYVLGEEASEETEEVKENNIPEIPVWKPGEF